MKGAEHSSAFSALASAKAKILILGPVSAPSAPLNIPGRSLNLEHVSPAFLVQQEISRRTSLGQKAGQAIARSSLSADVEQLHLAILRKWFWARKPDAGFLLEGFPATLLQALVFDEWLETRGETLTAVFTATQLPAGASAAACLQTETVATHYRTQGLPVGAIPAAA